MTFDVALWRPTTDSTLSVKIVAGDWLSAAIVAEHYFPGWTALAVAPGALTGSTA